MRLDLFILKELRTLMRFGTAVGIEIGAKNLEAVAVRVRPTGIRILGRMEIPNFMEQPAAEWGAEYSKFLKAAGAPSTSATVLLPRADVIVRQVALPGVAPRDFESALRLQLETLHPYGEDEVAWGWSPAGKSSALVGITPLSVVERYARVFTEAGIPICSFTFSAAALHAALRLDGDTKHQAFVAIAPSASGGFEAYGESPARPLFSAQLETTADRATSLALSELRLPPETAPLSLDEALPKPEATQAAKDLSRNAVLYATALAGACPRLAPAANVLPSQYRKSSSRMMLVPTLALAGALALVVGGGVLWSRMAHRNYLDRVRAESTKLMPMQARSAALDRETQHARARALWLEQYRDRTRKDLDLMKELTKLVEAPAWTRAMDLTRDSVRIQGEAPQAAALWKIIDSSKLFPSSNLEYNQPSPSGENFSIRATREGSR